VGGASVLIDDVFFKSDHLGLGNITGARFDSDVNGRYGNNLLLEKPQYAASYNEDRRTANWSAWRASSEWIKNPRTGLTADFISNPDLPEFDFDVRYDLTDLPEFDLGNTASLLTSTSEGDVILDTRMEDSFSVESLTVANSPVTNNSIQLTSNITPSTTPSRISQIAAVEDKFIEITANNLTISPVTVDEITTETTSFHDSILHIAPDQLGNKTVPPFTTGKIAVSEPTVDYRVINQDGFITNTIENSPSKIDSDKFNPIQADVLQNNTSEISFSSSISPEQFFSVHNSTPEIINALNNSATDIDGFDEQNIEPEAIYGIKSTNAPLTNTPYSRWVSSLNPTYAIGDRTDS
jgi:hypothetical protein